MIYFLNVYDFFKKKYCYTTGNLNNIWNYIINLILGEATDIVYFGRSSKRTNPKMIGRYGNGLKS